MGMEEAGMETDMETVYDEDEPQVPDAACPYCYRAENQPADDESHATPCPVCSQKLATDNGNHVTMRNGYLVENAHNSPTDITPDSNATSSFSRDVHASLLEAFLGYLQSKRSSNTAAATTKISSDPLLPSFGLGSNASESSTNTSIVSDGAAVRKETPPHPWESSTLTSEEREQKRQEATDRATFVQDLVFSTLFDED